jgi:hypothetical protein
MKLWVARFWSKVKVTDDERSCWLWTAGKSGSGYGMFTITENGFKSQVGAHVLAYTLHHGALPEGLWVLHKCNHRLCCNPTHLYAGTQVENMQDRKLKMNGRYGGGAARKLTRAQEMMLHAEFSRGAKQHALARKYKISDSTVSRILHDPSRKFIPNEQDPKGYIDDSE